MSLSLGESGYRLAEALSSYFFPPKSPPRFSGMAKPGGEVAGSCVGGLGAGGFWVGCPLVAMASGYR
jgi:hypothetical protein